MSEVVEVPRPVARPQAAPVTAERPIAATQRRSRRDWSLWIVSAAGSAALVAAGYLGALVQLGATQPHATQPIIPQPAASLPQAKSAASTTPTAVRIPTTFIAIGEPARIVVSTPRHKTHRVDVQAAARATAELERELERELDSEPAAVVTVRALSKPEAATGSRAQPSREDVQRALLAMRPQLEACAAGRRGVVDARVGIAGTGRVTRALIQGEFAGTQEGSCMARALRAATLPPFSGPVIQVQFPFAL